MASMSDVSLTARCAGMPSVEYGRLAKSTLRFNSLGRKNEVAVRAACQRSSVRRRAVCAALQSKSDNRKGSISKSVTTINEFIVPTQGEIQAPAMDFEETSSGTSFSEAMLNSVNILLGVGLLTIPYALSQGGWVAMGVLVLLGVTTNYTGKLLGICQERMCLVERQPSALSTSQFVRGLESYEDIGEAAFGKAGRLLITFVLYVELVGTCGLFFILEGDNLARIFGGDPQSYTLLSSLILIPTTWLPDLSALAALGALGAMASSSVLGVLLYTFVSEGFPVAASHSFANWSSLPFTFGLLSFVYAGHAVFPNIKSSMKDPSKYPQMLDWTYIIVGGVCATVGFVGYLMYGEDVFQEIILNLPPGLVALLATGLIIVNPFTKFALTMEPVAKGCEDLVQSSSSPGGTSTMSSAVVRIALRTGLGSLALFLATSVPSFANVMAVIGSCLTIIVSIIFPSLAYLELFGSTLKPSEKWWNYGVVGLGTFCAITGTYTSLSSLSSGGHIL